MGASPAEGIPLKICFAHSKLCLNQAVQVTDQIEQGAIEEEKDAKVQHHSSSGNLMDAKISYLDDVLNEKLERAFHKQTSQLSLHDIVKIASEHDPIDLAYAVTRLPPALAAWSMTIYQISAQKSFS